MHSKWQIWDFFSSYNRDTLKSFQGILALNTFDPICLKFVKDYLTQDLGDKKLHYKMSSEVTKSWIEEEFQTLSLFGDSESFFIHQANDLEPHLLDLLSKNVVQGRFVILSFENEQSLWKKLIKEGQISSLTIEAPPFWEVNKLLDFVCNYLRLPLSYSSKSWILESLENNLGSFYNCCCLIKLNHPESKEVSVQQVKELLTLERLDHFHMALLFSRKKRALFFDNLIKLGHDFEKMRAFFLFMQSHLIKLSDTSYLNKKSRLTKYDKDLQSTAPLWNLSDLMVEIKQFNDWEILSKKKSENLWTELANEHLRSLV